MTPRVVILGILVLLVATPRPAQPLVSADRLPSGATEAGRTGAPHSPGGTHSAGVRGQSADVWYPRPAGIPGGAPQHNPALITAPATGPYERLSGPALIPPPLTGTPADFTSQGTWAWADPSHGDRYLAIPEGPGYRVLVCGPAACLERFSTDAGPVKSLQRAGRLGDLSARDWLTVCGVELRFGLCPGSLTILGRRHPPETDQ